MTFCFQPCHRARLSAAVSCRALSTSMKSSGNSLYQPILDRYIAGEDVPFTEVQKLWLKTGEPAAGASAFVEQFSTPVRGLIRSYRNDVCGCWLAIRLLIGMSSRTGRRYAGSP